MTPLNTMASFKWQVCTETTHYLTWFEIYIIGINSKEPKTYVQQSKVNKENINCNIL